jgi:hypothetical protein
MCKLVRKYIDVNEHEKLPNITQIKLIEQRLYSYSTIHE